MIITCPNCHTRYQLADRAIGSAGRKVSCAQCQESWHAIPEPDAPAQPPKPKLVSNNPPEDKDRIFDAENEAELDAEFERAERAESGDGAAEPSDEVEPHQTNKRRKSDKAIAEDEAEADDADKIDAGLKGKRLRAMQARQIALRKKLPLGRIRSGARFLLLSSFLLLIGGGLFFRTDIVRSVPDMAGIYAAIGMPVNVIGLEFENVETLRTMQNGVDVMLVTGQVRNIGGGQVDVPPIVVSILDSDGASLYSWSVTPLSPFVGPREKLEFEARLNSAPENAAQVKLAFAEDR